MNNDQVGRCFKKNLANYWEISVEMIHLERLWAFNFQYRVRAGIGMLQRLYYGFLSQLSHVIFGQPIKLVARPLGGEGMG